jgi:hypothetical protein
MRATGQSSQARSAQARLFFLTFTGDISVPKIGDIDEVKVIHADGSEGTARLLVVAVVGQKPTPPVEAE